MCYAVSTSPDPMGSYYRYEFLRALFPDYPRPAIWTDGYYVPSSTGDTVIQKHACIADRAKMLKGEPATEQCVIIDDVNFLNNADIDGHDLPPAGAPNIMIANGGTQLKKVLEDNALLVWKLHVDWSDPAKTQAIGPTRLAVAPFHYLCDGQLSNCVPQPGTDRRLDHAARGLSPRKRARVDPRARLGEHGRGRWRRALVRAAARQESRPAGLSAGHVRTRRSVPVDGQRRHRQEGQHRHRLLIRRRE
jgi:hypothetical protein